MRVYMLSADALLKAAVAPSRSATALLERTSDRLAPRAPHLDGRQPEDGLPALEGRNCLAVDPARSRVRKRLVKELDAD
jgi:hypothetical protein